LELISEDITDFRKIEILTGLNELETGIHDLDSIAPYLSELSRDPFDVIDSRDWISIDDKTIQLPEDIAEKEWGQKIMAVSNMSEGNYLRMLSTYIQPIYDQKPYDDDLCQAIDEKIKLLPASVVFASIKYLFEKIKELSERESELLKSEVTPEQKRAGISMFDQLGEFNTIDLIAGGDVLKYDAVLRIDYNTILNKLFKLNLSSKFERNYNEILKESQS
jgi:hypothetical protein